MLAGALASLARLAGALAALTGLARALAGTLTTTAADQVIAARLAGTLAGLARTLAGTLSALATHHVVTTGVAARLAVLAILAGGTAVAASCTAVGAAVFAFSYSHVDGYVFHLLYPSLLFFHAEGGFKETPIVFPSMHPRQRNPKSNDQRSHREE